MNFMTAPKGSFSSYSGYPHGYLTTIDYTRLGISVKHSGPDHNGLSSWQVSRCDGSIQQVHEPIGEVNYQAFAGLLYAMLAQVGETLEEDSRWAVRIRTVVDIFENAVRMRAGDEALVNLALAGLKQVEDIVNSEDFLQK